MASKKASGTPPKMAVGDWVKHAYPPGVGKSAVVMDEVGNPPVNTLYINPSVDINGTMCKMDDVIALARRYAKENVVLRGDNERLQESAKRAREANDAWAIKFDRLNDQLTTHVRYMSIIESVLSVLHHAR